MALVEFRDLAANVTERVDDPSRAGVARYVGLEHLDSMCLAVNRWGVPTDVSATKLRFRPGDIIFGRRRAYQRKVAVATFDGICSAHALVLRAQGDALLPDLLPYFMSSRQFYTRALAISVGGLSPTINWTTLVRQTFEIPEFDRQKALLPLLTASNDVWCELQGVLVAWERLLISHRQEFLNRPWPRIPLGDVAQLRGGSGFPHRFQGRLSGDLPFIKVSDFNSEGNERGIRTSANYVLHADLPQLKARVFPVGTVVFAKVGAALTHNRKRLLERDTLIDNNLMGATPDDGHVSAEYLLTALEAFDMRKLVRAGPIPSLAQSDLQRVRIPVPPRRDQGEYEEQRSELQAHLEAARERTSIALRLRQALIDEAFDVH